MDGEMSWFLVIEVGFTLFGVVVFALWLRYVTRDFFRRTRNSEEQVIARELSRSVWIVFWLLIVLPSALRLTGFAVVPGVVLSLLLIWTMRFSAERKLRKLR